MDIHSVEVILFIVLLLSSPLLLFSFNETISGQNK